MLHYKCFINAFVWVIWVTKMWFATLINMEEVQIPFKIPLLRPLRALCCIAYDDVLILTENFDFVLS